MVPPVATTSPVRYRTITIPEPPLPPAPEFVDPPPPPPPKLVVPAEALE